MKHMGLTEEDKKEMAAEESVLERNQYPYGLKLHIDEETYKKLLLDGAPVVGQKFAVVAMAEVSDVQQVKRRDDQMNISFGLQITDMELKEGKKEEKKTEDIMYGE